jgi:hypothetical protein
VGVHAEVLLAAGYAGVLLGLDFRPAIGITAQGATAPPSSPTTTRTAPGTAPKIRSYGAPRWITSGT